MKLRAALSCLTVVVSCVACVACDEPRRMAIGQGVSAACDECMPIRIVAAVTLKTPEPTGRALYLARAAPDGNVWTVTGRNVRVFSDAGDFLGTFGPLDASAVRGIDDLVVLPDTDSVLIADNATQSLVVLDRSGDGMRAVQLPAGAIVRSLAVLDWPDRVLFTGRVGVTNGLFELSARGDFAVVARDRYSAAAPSSVPHHYRLPQGLGSDVWALDSHTSTLSMWDDLGQITAPARRVRLQHSASRASRVHAVSRDSAGRIWVYTRVATDLARRAWRSPEARRAGGRIELGTEVLYHTLVEVLDPVEMRLIGRALVEEFVISAVGGSQAVFYSNGLDGRPRTRLYTFELVLQPAGG